MVQTIGLAVCVFSILALVIFITDAQTVILLGRTIEYLTGINILLTWPLLLGGIIIGFTFGVFLVVRSVRH